MTSLDARAQRAYEIWCDLVRKLPAPKCKTLPPWADLPPDEREKWIAHVVAVAQICKKPFAFGDF